MKITNINDAFAVFNAEPINHVWSWSAISKDKTNLILSIWADQYQLNPDANYISFRWSNFGCDNHLC